MSRSFSTEYGRSCQWFKGTEILLRAHTSGSERAVWKALGQHFANAATMLRNVPCAYFL
jgi:hypothetical protein